MPVKQQMTNYSIILSVLFVFFFLAFNTSQLILFYTLPSGLELAARMCVIFCTHVYVCLPV